MDAFLHTYRPDDDGYRRELVDGQVVMTPNPGGRHQGLGVELAFALRAATRGTRYRSHLAVNVRLSPTQLLIPDLVVSTRTDLDFVFLEACEVVLVVEVVSPGSGSARDDRDDKPTRYAAAGIPWFLRIDPEPPGGGERAAFHRLNPARRRYDVVRSSSDRTIRLTEPVSVTLPVTVD